MVGGDHAGRGVLIAFEGIDGCGKSTQVDRLAAWIAQRHPGRAVHRPREPGGTPLGERVRELLLHGDNMSSLTEMLLYMVSRAELYERVVLPALADDGVVLLDRSHYSTAAYQGAGLGLDEDLIFALAREATGGRAPDRVVLLEMDVEVAAARVGGDADGRTAVADRIERRSTDYFRAVAAAYSRYALAEPQRFLSVDATGTPDEVFARIREGLSDVL